VAEYGNMVFAIALTHTPRRTDAQDVFQEAFLAYHRKQPAFLEEERRRAWLIKTTLNCARQLTGSSYSRKVVPLYGSALEGPAADDFSFRTAEQDAIFRALRGLSLHYRTVIHLFYFEDLSIAQIAEALELAPGTVRVRLSRARAQLRQELKGSYFDD